MSDYKLEEGVEIRVPNLIFEEKGNEEDVKDVLFFNAEIDELDENYVYISTSGENDHYDGERFPRELVQAWQYRPYLDVDSYENRANEESEIG